MVQPHSQNDQSHSAIRDIYTSCKPSHLPTNSLEISFLGYVTKTHISVASNHGQTQFMEKFLPFGLSPSCFNLPFPRTNCQPLRKSRDIHPKFHIAPDKCGGWKTRLSYSEGNFSGTLLNLWGGNKLRCTCKPER